MAHTHSPTCRHTLSDRLAEAQHLCSHRGVRFTDMRQAVFEALLACSAPISAYDLLAHLQTNLARKLAPPTVYRALEFLLEQGLIHRLETTQAYLACNHPGIAHESVYFVCSACGKVQELEDPAVAELLALKAQSLGFAPARPVIEVQGLCAGCH